MWQRQYLSGERLMHQLNYWKAKLSNYEGLHLPTDKPRPAEINYAGKNVYFNIDAVISQQLRETAKKHGVSLYSVLLAGFNLLLHSYSNQNDIVIGTPIANRHHEQLEDLIGFFVNSLALRSQISPEQTVGDYIEIVGRDIIEAQLHQDLPFEKLVDELMTAKDPSRHPLFQVMFGIQSFGRVHPESNHLTPFTFYDLKIEDTAAKFDLSLFIDDSQEALRGTLNYAVGLFNPETVKELISTYLHLLEQLSDESKTIKQLSYLSPADYKKIIRDWNQTEKAYLEHKTIHQLFEEQVNRTPNHIAVVYEDTQLTYSELNQRANQLAHYLRQSYAIQGDDLIALCLDRSEQMLIAILAVLKSGAAYVPMDPGYPEERVVHILRDTQAKVVLANMVYADKLSQLINDNRLSTTIEIIDHVEKHSQLVTYPTTNLIQNIDSHHLAYVIYTSGTTGQPKGVMIEHNSVINTITALAMVYALSAEDKVSEFTSYVFDVSVSEIFVTLFNGAQLYLLSEKTRIDANLISEYLLKNKINVSYLPPVILSNINKIDYPNLNRLIYAGEPCNPVVGKYWSTHKLLFNYFGPTETAIYCLGKQVIEGDVHLIGKPMANVMAYVLDSSLNPLPIGSIGELYIGGAGLARGYLNLPKLTAERFIPNPFQSESEKRSGKNAKLYKTGDLVRYLPDGSIEYIGRNDFQVKIRGFRIELAEIEGKLVAYPDIKQAVVLAKEHRDANGVLTGNKYLAGYYVSS